MTTTNTINTHTTDEQWHYLTQLDEIDIGNELEDVIQEINLIVMDLQGWLRHRLGKGHEWTIQGVTEGHPMVLESLKRSLRSEDYSEVEPHVVRLAHLQKGRRIAEKLEEDLRRARTGEPDLGI